MDSMPSRKTHETITALVLGEKFSEVHRVIDAPVSFLHWRHRELFHSIPEVVLIGLITTRSIQGVIAGILHITADNIDAKLKKFSKNKQKNV